ncbi:cytochrome-c oxidase [Paenibacillus thiaminolyticus]|uniref:cytochrome-c oxidase n=1 Tax=Paenibacillus thiaminolyticus TaxID=49283 RepID=UPI002543B044|nr:cytochrome-c oxidase [Paenibacillus thiaminolyticus]WII37351.1 cytochrome-c oxidase [Paenibacillus thiaminolyticus]
MTVGVRFIKVAAVYFVAGVGAGLIAGATNQFQYTSLHAHLNLLGWVSLAISGLIYARFPQAGASTLGTVHFWLHNIGLPIFLAGLAMAANGADAATALLIGGGIISVLAVLAFAINVWKNVR